VRAVLAFDGQIRRGRYAVASGIVFLSQHLAVLTLLAVVHRHVDLDINFFVVPLRAVADLQLASVIPAATFPIAFAYMLLVAWILAVLAFRRSTDAGATTWTVAAVLVPRSADETFVAWR
jgi:hypothetical protein